MLKFVQLPFGARVISFVNLNEAPVIYAEAYKVNDTEPREFYLQYTGWEVPEMSRFVGTAVFTDTDGSPLVVHCYEVLEGGQSLLLDRVEEEVKVGGTG